MISELLQQKENFAIGKWTPCPPISNREAWDFLPSFDLWVEAGNAAAKKKIPPLPLSLWLTFSKTGNRSKYEAAYFERKNMLVHLVMAECMANTGDLIPKIADIVWAICEESAWQLPAHNSYWRDAPQLELPNTKSPIVDLFAAETAALLSMVYYLLKKPLDAYASKISARIVREVDIRVLNPWQKSHFWWMGNGDEPMCNWTPWCTQNILISTALLHGNSPLRIHHAVKQAAYSIDCFLEGYGEDGCCNEGAQYYEHAGLTLYNCLQILCALAPNIFDNVWKEKKIKNIAEYIVYMHVSGAYYFNFADCSPRAGFRGTREYLFAEKVKSTALLKLAATDFIKDPDPYHLHSSDASKDINLFYAVQTAFMESEIRRTSVKDCAKKDIWYPSNGLRILHRDSYALGIKAGNNADSHNHNDVGSVTLYKENQPLLIDVGVETYSRKTFSPERYSIWTMQSAWHNLPTFIPDTGDEYLQQAGEEFCASQIDVLPNGLSMNIEKAYGTVPTLGYYHRTVQLTNDGCCIEDETDFASAVAVSFMSVEKPALEQSQIKLGNLGCIQIKTPVENCTIEEVPITDARLRLAWPSVLYRTRIYFRQKISLEIQ